MLRADLVRRGPCFIGVDVLTAHDSPGGFCQFAKRSNENQDEQGRKSGKDDAEGHEVDDEKVREFADGVRSVVDARDHAPAERQQRQRFLQNHWLFVRPMFYHRYVP